MTSSQWLDMAVLAIAFVAAMSGWRSGALGSVLSFVGVALGAVAGLLLRPYIMAHIADETLQRFAALLVILALIVVGEVAGVVLGQGVRASIRNNTLQRIDSIIGVALQLVVVLTAAWLLGSLVISPNQPKLTTAVKGSRVWQEVNGAAPEWLRNVPRRLSAAWNTSGWPDLFSNAPIAAVDAPNAALGGNPVVAATEPSVVKVRGVATSCEKVLEGTGFVVAPNRVMTNAHVVAGSSEVNVDVGTKSYEATVVSFDSDADIAILAVADLPEPPLVFADSPARADTDAIVLGYPGGGIFEATPARIREIIELNGPDIYQRNTVTREVYTIRGLVRQGNSGGPLIDVDGKVLGVVFGAAVDDSDTGFVLTAKEVGRQMIKIGDTAAVSTQTCVG